MKVNSLLSLMKTYHGTLCDFAIWFKRGKQENLLYLENTARQKSKFIARTTHYPTQYGYTQTEFKYREPSIVNITGLITRKGTGLLGYNYGISSIAAGNKTKKQCINETREDLKYLIERTVLCEVWSLNGGTHKYMTLTNAEIFDDREHVGLFEVDLTLEEVPPLILEPEPANTILATTSKCGLAQCLGKE